MQSLITRKVGMTSTIDQNGATAAITLLSVEDHTVISHKTLEKDGYSALQVGTETNKKLSKSVTGHVKKSKVMPKIIKEFRVEQIPENLNVGDKYSADVFEVGDKVTATGINKGKGFAGTIKRHNFHLGRKTHGGRSYRRPGSIGSMYPQKIFKGKKMAGQMGHQKTTIRGLKISLVDKEKGIIGVKGAVPGPRKSLVILKGVK
ncbi:MAG TPA: 50S ribosomal protein L3 [Patescibacteria group bacterium]|nr:50S ribosomal protein L3 [Patescibacteria group bacterium]